MPFTFSIADYGMVCDTIHALQAKSLGNQKDKIFGILHKLGGSQGSQPFMSIRVSHTLFTVCHWCKLQDHILIFQLRKRETKMPLMESVCNASCHSKLMLMQLFNKDC
jgi:hypothetical protein